MKKNLNNIIALIVASVLTFLIFHIKLEPPKVKTFNLNDVIGVSTLSKEQLQELMKVAKTLKFKSSYSNKVRRSRKKSRRYTYRKRKVAYRYKKRRVGRAHKVRNVHLAKSKAYSKLKVKSAKKTIEKRIYKKTVYFSIGENKTSLNHVPGIPMTYLELLKEIISSNFFYPEEAFEKNIQGDVVIKFGLNKYGKLIFSKVVKSDSNILAKAALVTIRKCKFPPFPADLKYDEVYFIVKIKYQIKINNF